VRAPFRAGAMPWLDAACERARRFPLPPATRSCWHRFCTDVGDGRDCCRR
jgi:hypothetical protein